MNFISCIENINLCLELKQFAELFRYNEFYSFGTGMTKEIRVRVTAKVYPPATIYLGYVFACRTTRKNIPGVCSCVEIFGDNLPNACFFSGCTTCESIPWVYFRGSYDLQKCTLDYIVVEGTAVTVTPG